MKIQYELNKKRPESGNWSDPSEWTMLTNINGVRIGALTMKREELLERIEKAHGPKGAGFIMTALWAGREEMYLVKESK